MSEVVSVSGALDLKRQIQLLELSRKNRRRVIKKITRSVQKNSKARIRTQKDLDGRKFAPRKRKDRKGSKRRKRKMLRGLSKQLKNWATAEKGTVGYQSRKTAKIAHRHQQGHEHRYDSGKQREFDKAYYDDPATKKQAVALKKEGFKRPRKNGKGYANASIRWIMENYTIGRAGLILSEMRGTSKAAKERKASGKQKVIVTPARSFLGVDEPEINEHIRTVFDETLQQL
ncbi:phage virion morphogenesis protein [Marinibactrum halimedae]|uniref:Phage virion morphogenesis protein n=1 Tax=Marinibactrum halimedae TaxID=1444977 RepID=A0AA37T5R2_9GAMM|nr:phage virion morphogenesis protein [Marinibactrum halimedae]MCD9458464.1 phage virion morphogenesis protein [Marinibactrum halimedae]GLS26161.1 hypothetical protein GCM10007877_18760 [Marinibactrum halimedae]